MQHVCVFCNFKADSRGTLLQHCEAEHTRGVDVTPLPKCSCFFIPISWEDLRIHLWQRHGGGIKNRPACPAQLSPEELKKLIHLVSAVHEEPILVPYGTGQTRTRPREKPPQTVRVHSPPPSTTTQNSWLPSPEFQPPEENHNNLGHFDHTPRYPTDPIEAPSPRPLPDSRQKSPNGVYEFTGYTRGPPDYPVTPTVSQQNGRDSRKRPSVEHLEDKPEPKMPKMFFCELCERAFETENSLTQHRIDSHPYGRTVVFKCDECGCQFLLYKKALQHIRTHGAHDPEKYVREDTVEKDELPLLRCAEPGCQYRSTFKALVRHKQHDAVFNAIIPGAPTRREREETHPKSKGGYTDVPYQNGITSNKHSHKGVYETFQHLNEQKDKFREISCVVRDGYIKVPVEKMRGKYIMVSADASGSSPELVVNITDPKADEGRRRGHRSSRPPLLPTPCDSRLK